MIKYEYNKACKLQLLKKQVESQLWGTKLLGMSSDGINVIISFYPPLEEGEKASLDAIVQSHSPTEIDFEQVIKDRMVSAAGELAEVMAQFGSENKRMVVQGEITPQQLFSLTSNLASIQLLAMSGSADMVRSVWQTLPVMPGLSQERKDKYLSLLDKVLEKIATQFPL